MPPSIRIVKFFTAERILAIEGDFPNVGLISITDPDRKLRLRSTWASVLQIRFRNLEDAYHRQVAPFTEYYAEQIVKWLRQNEDRFKGVYVHCVYGLSRSAAVAKFVAEVYNIPLNAEKTRFYDPLTYGLLKAQWA
jgi:predicted protein tyrosine phosphatase